MNELRPPSHLSLLQQKILQIVCTKENVTYQTLMKETKRDRITVLQSTESLIKYNYINKKKRDPEYEKSKLIFKPTLGGKSAAVRSGVALEDILKIEPDEETINYFELLNDIDDPLQRKVLIEPLRELLGSLAVYQYKEKELQQFKKEKLKEILRKGVTEIVFYRNYDAESFLNDRSIKHLKKLFTPREIKELKDVLVRGRDNLDITIRRLRE
jgi:hypothetical protein